MCKQPSATDWSAAGTAQVRRSVACPDFCCQISDKMALRPFMLRFLSNPQSGGHRPPRAGIRARPERPDGGDRRGKVNTGRRCRTAGRRARLSRPASGPVRTRRPSRPSSTGRTATRSSCGGRSPRRAAAAPSSTVHWRPARRSAISRASWWIFTVSTSTRSCWTRRPTSTCSTRSPGSTPSGPSSRRRSRRGRTSTPSASGCSPATRENAHAREFLTFQLAEIEQVAPSPGEDDELAATRQVLANADRLQRLRRSLRGALRGGARGAAGARQPCGSASAIWRLSMPRSRPHLEARDVVKSQLEDLAFFLRVVLGGIDASPDRLQEVEDRLARSSV